MTIRRLGKGRGFSGRKAQGVGTPADTAAAQISDPRLRFSEHGTRYFTDVGFPARRDDLYASAVAHGAPPVILKAIRSLPLQVYGGADELPDLYEIAGTDERTGMMKGD